MKKIAVNPWLIILASITITYLFGSKETKGTEEKNIVTIVERTAF